MIARVKHTGQLDYKAAHTLLVLARQRLLARPATSAGQLAGVHGKALAALRTAKHQQCLARQPSAEMLQLLLVCWPPFCITPLCCIAWTPRLHCEPAHLPAAFRTSLAMGTVELTGLEMISMIACRQ